MQITCPYDWCSATITLIDSGKDPQPMTRDRLEGLEIENLSPLIIPSHQIDNRLLTGRCVASLMHYPIRPGSRHREILIEQAEVDEHRIQELLDRMLQLADAPTYRPESQSLRGPHRIGREPVVSSDDPDWALGGRQDEDIQPEPKWHKPPKDIYGFGAGKVSVQETIAAINDAAIQIGEGRAQIDQSLGSLSGSGAAIEQARASVQAAKGDIESETLNEYIAVCLRAEDELRQAQQQLEEANQKLGAAIELGERYAAILGS